MEASGKFQALIAMAATMTVDYGVDWKTAVRRTLGTAERSYDADRVAAAEAKRASRMARNIRNQKRES
jgi:hypothetical protein